jgi:predicted nucleic acid-binding OB-fold protein
VTVKLEAFGEAAPLVFDANTAHDGILRLIPGIRPEQVERWVAERSREPFSSLEDVRRRTGVQTVTN